MKWLALVLALAFLPSASGAQATTHTYIGVYFDDTHTSWCVTQTPPYTVELWVWALPGVYGLSGAVFDFDYTGVDIPGDLTYHPNIVIRPTACQKPCPYFSRGYADCQTDWVWLFHATVLVSTSEPLDIAVLPHLEDFPYVAVFDCDDVERPATVLSNGHVNYCGPLPVETRTWGAIKSLYR